MLYEKKKKDTFVAENAGNPLGEMLEWLKRHAWKACKPLKGFAGSNPALSAETQRQKGSKIGRLFANSSDVICFSIFNNCIFKTYYPTIHNHAFFVNSHII